MPPRVSITEAVKPGLRSAVPGAAYGSIPSGNSPGGGTSPDPVEPAMLADEDASVIVDDDDMTLEVD